MINVSLLWDTNMAAVTSSENTLLIKSTGYKLVPRASPLAVLRTLGMKLDWL